MNDIIEIFWVSAVGQRMDVYRRSLLLIFLRQPEGDKDKFPRNENHGNIDRKGEDHSPIGDKEWEEVLMLSARSPISIIAFF